ncbi:uncharacterized protein LOC131970221 [Centropristis striata]|uniref:uncharacterized protein LOC131964402 n=1 Tax=Centropristis striata TaxID=184440 RepID=UPI0027E100AC|nr:uncharacterized protein LOC131964402 [Centropristis striata]XP_059187546.1 uncharacterized protein LOC131970221 [Centropristis striata]
MSKHYVTSKQAPAAEEEMAVDLSSKVYGEDDDDAGEDDAPKEFAIRGSCLVDYSDTDGTDEDCLNDQPLAPRCDEGVPKLRRTKSIWMKKVPDFSDALYDSDDSTEGPSAQSKSEMALQRMHTLEDFCQPVSDSDESIVEETDFEDSTKDDSTEQSDIEVLPKLWTKIIQMKNVPDYSDALYHSSDDSAEDPSTWSKSEMSSQRRRRSCFRPRLLKLKIVHKRISKMQVWQKIRVQKMRPSPHHHKKAPLPKTRGGSLLKREMPVYQKLRNQKTRTAPHPYKRGPLQKTRGGFQKREVNKLLLKEPGQQKNVLQ